MVIFFFFRGEGGGGGGGKPSYEYDATSKKYKERKTSSFTKEKDNYGVKAVFFFMNTALALWSIIITILGMVHYLTKR